LSTIMGTFSHRQGHETAFFAVVAQKSSAAVSVIDFRRAHLTSSKWATHRRLAPRRQMGASPPRAACVSDEKAKRLAAARARNPPPPTSA